PASASFSGVVTTGAQIFEGDKTFLKSPKVPNATNADEAVNKSQLDSVGNAIPDFTTYFKFVSSLQIGTDLDNVTEMGSYIVGNTGASSILNKPVATSLGFSLKVYNQGQYLVQEIYYNESPNNKYYRIS